MYVCMYVYIRLYSFVLNDPSFLSFDCLYMYVCMYVCIIDMMMMMMMIVCIY